MIRSTYHHLLMAALCAVGLSLYPADGAHAQSGSWNVNAGGSWGNAGNWSGTIAGGAGATADFSLVNITADHIVTLDGNRTITTLITGDAAAPNFNWTFNPGAPASSELALSGSAALQIFNPTTTINAVVSGSGAIRKHEAGNLVLTGANTFTGNLHITGPLTFNSVGNVGGGPSSLGAPVTAANGAIRLGDFSTGGQLTYVGTGHTSDRLIEFHGQQGNSSLSSSGSGPLVFTSGILNTQWTTNGQPKTFTLGGTNTDLNEIGGPIVNHLGELVTTNGAARTSISKTGSGTWVLSGDNTYSGTTNVSNGTLLVNGTHTATDTHTGVNASYSIASGATFGGSGTIDLSAAANTHNVTFANGSLLAPDSALTFSLGDGTLNLSAMNTSATMMFALDTPATSDQVVLESGSLNIGTLDFDEFVFSPQGGFGNGAYALFLADTIVGNIGVSSGMIGEYDAELTLLDGSVVLNVTGGPISNAVPEPASLAIWVLAGLLALCLARGRRPIVGRPHARDGC